MYKKTKNLFHLVKKHVHRRLHKLCTEILMQEFTDNVNNNVYKPKSLPMLLAVNKVHGNDSTKIKK